MGAINNIISYKKKKKIFLVGPGKYLFCSVLRILSLFAVYISMVRKNKYSIHFELNPIQRKKKKI